MEIKSHPENRKEVEGKNKTDTKLKSSLQAVQGGGQARLTTQ